MSHMAFRQWLNEATDQPPEVPMVGFVFRWQQHDQTMTSRTYKTMLEVYAAKKKFFDETKIPSGLFFLFKDGTMRPVGNCYDVAWHLNRAGRIINDYAVERSGRGKTNHGFLARNDRTIQFHSILNTLHHELRPGNMPSQSGDELPQEFWDRVNSALEHCMKDQTLSYMAELYDLLVENYDPHHEAVNVCLYCIRNGLHRGGIEVPEYR